MIGDLVEKTGADTVNIEIEIEAVVEKDQNLEKDIIIKNTHQNRWAKESQDLHTETTVQKE
jgi:hypothetical protein